MPQDRKNKTDLSIQNGFSWLIQTIDDNYTKLNLRVTKGKNNQANKKPSRFQNDENDSDDSYSKRKNISYTSKITSEKLPSIHANKTTRKMYSDDDDDDNNDKDRSSSSSSSDFYKKKNITGTSKTNNTLVKKSTDNEPKPFRATYEPFPEESPWSMASPLKSTKSDDTLLKLYTKPSIANDTKRRNISPLVHDTKPYTYGSLSKRDNVTNDDDDLYNQQKSKVTFHK